MAKSKPAPPAPREGWTPGVSDAFLRGAGFKIHSRPSSQEPTWTRGNRLYLQSRAEELAISEITQQKGK